MSRGGRGKRPQGFARVAESLLAYVEKLSNAIHGGWRRAVAVALTVILSLQMVLSGGLSQAVAYAYAEQQAYEAASQPVTAQSGDVSAARLTRLPRNRRPPRSLRVPASRPRQTAMLTLLPAPRAMPSRAPRSLRAPLRGGGLLRKALRRTAR